MAMRSMHVDENQEIIDTMLLFVRDEENSLLQKLLEEMPFFLFVFFLFKI